MYGSSRLGVKNYLPGQVYARVDLTGSSPVMDTMQLTARRPWYSLELNDVIGGGAVTPWGMADQGNLNLAGQIGQKQYELSNHLGNVQATVSDLPYHSYYIAEPMDSLVDRYEPALAGAYDYYPFGMLMPGRYVSDTSRRCMTISKSNWTTVLIDTCIASYSIASAVSTSGTASAGSSGGNLVLTAPAASDMLVITQNAAAGVMNTVQFDISRITGGGDNGVQVIMVEEINNIEYVIGSGYLQQGSKQSLNFTPTINVAKLKIYGPFDEMLIATTCTKKAATVQHTYLVDVCDEDKDRYRFGFNGQEKVNEIAGVGNHNTAEFWEYDTRLGRRWNLDPVDQVNISNYAVNRLNPISFNDPNGDYSKVGAHLRSFVNGGKNVG